MRFDLPFDDASFDIVWTEHAQMNIGDKAQLYDEIARVLRPSGKLVLHDVFQGPGGEPKYPLPWAKHVSISFLASPGTVRQTLEQVGLQIVHWIDTTPHALTWFDEAIKRVRTAKSAPLGLHLLMGETAHLKFTNQIAESPRESSCDRTGCCAENLKYRGQSLEALEVLLAI